jgi:hypothetical protein
MLPNTVLRLWNARARCATPAAIVTGTLTPFTSTSAKSFCMDLKKYKRRLPGEPIPGAQLTNMPELALMEDGEEKRRRMEVWVSNPGPHKHPWKIRCKHTVYTYIDCGAA